MTETFLHFAVAASFFCVSAALVAVAFIGF